MNYAVKDDESYNDFGHQESSDGNVVTGSYRVLLPDGRTQTVTYKVDDYSGYVAHVEYEGVAKYPEYKPKYDAPAPHHVYTDPSFDTLQEFPLTVQEEFSRFAYPIEDSAPPAAITDTGFSDSESPDSITEVYPDPAYDFPAPEPYPPHLGEVYAIPAYPAAPPANLFRDPVHGVPAAEAYPSHPGEVYPIPAYPVAPAAEIYPVPVYPDAAAAEAYPIPAHAAVIAADVYPVHADEVNTDPVYSTSPAAEAFSNLAHFIPANKAFSFPTNVKNLFTWWFNS